MVVAMRQCLTRFEIKALVDFPGREPETKVADWLAAPAVLSGSMVSDTLPPAKRQRTAAECINELKELKGLLDAGAVSRTEFEKLKAEMLAGM